VVTSVEFASVVLTDVVVLVDVTPGGLQTDGSGSHGAGWQSFPTNLSATSFLFPEQRRQ
jgi:hypothetical protein